MILSEINSTIKYIVIGAAIFLAFVLINKIQSCSGPSISKPPVEIVEQNKSLEKVSSDLLKDLPANVKVYGSIIDKQKSEDPSKTVEITHVIHSDPNGNTGTVKYTDVIKTKNVYGFVLEPKFYAGYVVNQSLNVGLGLAVVRLNKTTLDVLVSVPYVGLGTSYQLTNNTFIGVAGTAKYVNYKEIGDLSSYSANSEMQYSILPLVYLGARF